MKKNLIFPISIIIVLFSFLLFCGGNTTTKTNETKSTENQKSDLDTQLDSLTKQIIENLTKSSKSKIAVIDFYDIDGNLRQLGRYLVEELTTRLFMTKEFKVIERSQLDKVLNELELSSTAVFDEKTTKQLGKLLGVDAIATGSLADLGRSIKVNARLINIGTAEIFAVASVQIAKSDSVVKMWDKIITPVANKSTNDSSSTTDSGKVTTSSTKVEEDKQVDSIIIRWAVDSEPRGANIYWRVISGTKDVQNTTQSFLGKTPYEETRAFDIKGLTFANSNQVSIEIKVSKTGYNEQVKKFNCRSAIDQKEINAMYELVKK